MAKIWIVYPYGQIVGENFLEARHIRFGRLLAEAGHNVVFWTSNFSHTTKTKRSKSWKKIKVVDHFYIQLVPSWTYKKNISVKRVLSEIKFAFALKKAFEKSKKPDLIITAGTGLITSFYPIWPYMKYKDVRVIYDIMDVHMFEDYVNQRTPALLPAAKFIVKFIEHREKNFYYHISGVTGLGKNQLAIAKRRTGKKNIPSWLIYNGINIQQFKERLNERFPYSLPEKKEKWKWIVYTGSLGPSYDMDSLIACADIAKKNKDKFLFIVAGAGPQSKLLKNAAEKNGHLLFLGTLKVEELPSLYSYCDIGLCPYARYSTVDMPDKFYDYCAAGLAVVNSLYGEISQYIEKEQLGLQYEPENSVSMYCAIKKIIEGDENKYKKNASHLALKFDFRKQFEPFLEYLKNGNFLE